MPCPKAEPGRETSIGGVWAHFGAQSQQTDRCADQHRGGTERSPFMRRGREADQPQYDARTEPPGQHGEQDWSDDIGHILSYQTGCSRVLAGSLFLCVRMK